MWVAMAPPSSPETRSTPIDRVGGTRSSSAQRLPGRDQHQLSLEAEPVQFRDDLRYLGELGAGAPDERESAQKDQNVACRAVPFHGLKTPSPRLVYNCHTSRPRVTMITGT